MVDDKKIPTYYESLEATIFDVFVKQANKRICD